MTSKLSTFTVFMFLGLCSFADDASAPVFDELKAALAVAEAAAANEVYLNFTYDLTWIEEALESDEPGRVQILREELTRRRAMMKEIASRVRSTRDAAMAAYPQHIRIERREAGEPPIFDTHSYHERIVRYRGDRYKVERE